MEPSSKRNFQYKILLLLLLRIEGKSMEQEKQENLILL